MNALLLAVGLGMGSSAVAEVPVHQFVIQLAVCKGDPLGSKAGGTVDILSRPQIAVQDGQIGCVQVGRGVPVPGSNGKVEFVQTGLVLKVLPKMQNDGSVLLRLDSRITESAPGGVALGNGLVAPTFNTTATATLCKVKAGEPLRIRLSAASATDQTWIEATLHIVRSVPRELD